MIETENLNIYVTSRAEMGDFIESQTSDILKMAYQEMLDGCLLHPEQWEWYAIWKVNDGSAYEKI